MTESEFMNNLLFKLLTNTNEIPQVEIKPLTFLDYLLWGLLLFVIMVPWIIIIFLWIFKRYRVQFIGFNGEVLSSKYYKKNSMFEIPNVEIPGYEFEGWYEDSELLYPLSFNYVTESNVKIYGKWIKKDEI